MTRTVRTGYQLVIIIKSVDFNNISTIKYDDVYFSFNIIVIFIFLIYTNV